MFTTFLSDRQKDVAIQAMRYADSIFFSYALDAVFGITHEQFIEVIERWPNSDECKGVAAAIDGSLLISTLGIPPANWDEWFSASKEEVTALKDYWISLRPRFSGIHAQKEQNELG